MVNIRNYVQKDMTNPDDMVLLSSCMFDHGSSNVSSHSDDNNCATWGDTSVSNECWKMSSCAPSTLGTSRGISGATRNKSGRHRKGARPVYKHVPHREKPPQIVARRNARERRRVQAVNTAFSRLRKVVPIENR